MKKRLIEFLSYLDVGQNKFEEIVGLSRGFVNKVGDSIRETSLQKISDHYPDLNIAWLKTGQGNMLLSGGNHYGVNQKHHGKPYYDVDFIAGFDLVTNDQTENPAYHIDFRQYNNADCWVNATGDSMKPMINHGDIIAIRRLEDWRNSLLYGEIYALVTNEFRTIKKVRKSNRGDGWFRLVPINTDEYDEQDISCDSILYVYQVIGCAKKFF